jgi:NAD(P)H dehydrogenase (quinone)
VAEPAPPTGLARPNRSAQADLSIGFSLVRPSSFSSLLAYSVRGVKAGSWGGAAGDGRVNMVDTRDVAEVTARLLYTASDPDLQRPYHLTGDRSWTMSEIADVFTERLGQPVTYEQRTPSEQRRLLSGAGLPELYVEILVGLDRIFATGAQSETTTTVAEILGRPPRSVPDWITDNLDLFR